MLAVRFHDYGGLDAVRYEEAPVPDLTAGNVLVRVKAAGVNPFDCYAVEGYVNRYVSFALPAVLGRDVSGIVEGVGKGTDEFAIGDAVYGQTDPRLHGTFADFTLIEPHRLARKPEHLSHVEAASLPNVLLAAWSGVFSEENGAAVRSGDAVLIHGAAGGIGTIAAQLARWRGARVFGSASRHNLEFLLDSGLERVFDYSLEDWQAEVGTVNSVLNTGSGDAADALCSIIGSPGRYVAFRGLPEPAFVAKQAARGIRCVSASGPASLVDFPRMAHMVAQGLIKPVLNAVYPMAKFRDALEQVRNGHVRGKVVLSVAD